MHEKKLVISRINDDTYRKKYKREESGRNKDRGKADTSGVVTCGRHNAGRQISTWGASHLERERERRDEGPTSTAKWIDPSRWIKNLSLFTPTHRPNTLFHWVESTQGTNHYCLCGIPAGKTYHPPSDAIERHVSFGCWP